MLLVLPGLNLDTVTPASVAPAPAPGLFPAVVTAREMLATAREKVRQQHASGFPGVQVCAHLTDDMESVVVDLFRDALASLAAPLRSRLEPGLAIIAHSGFGRREMAPYSD